MSETNATPTVETSATPKAAAQPAAKVVEQSAVQKPEGATEATAPDKLGSQLWASKRLDRKLSKRQSELAQQEATARQLLSQVDEYKNLSAAEIVKREAQRRGTQPDALIRDAIGELTGQSKTEVKLDDKTDPNIRALYEQLEAEKKARSDIERKLKEREDAEKLAAQEKQQKEGVARVTQDCDESSKLAWEAEPDLSIVFDDSQELSKAIFAKMRTAVEQYVKQYGKPPSDEECMEAIKEAPQIILAEARQSPRFKRIQELRAQAESAKPVARGSLLKGPKVDPENGGPEKKPVQLVTKISDASRIANAAKSIPDNAVFFGFQHGK